MKVYKISVYNMQELYVPVVLLISVIMLFHFTFYQMQIL